jgi:hypothetical protein
MVLRRRIAAHGRGPDGRQQAVPDSGCLCPPDYYRRALTSR